MNVKRFIAGGIAIFFIFLVLDFIVHGIILGKVYMSMANVWRPDMMSLSWVMYLNSFIFSFLMMYVFIKGYEGRGLFEGIRFGILICLITNGSGALYQYSVYPLPFSLVLQWFGYGLIEFVIAGIAAAAIYRPVPEYSELEEKSEN